MLKFAKVINEETKQCEVGLGTNAKFYASIGMTEMEVEQGYDGQWYLQGYASTKPQEQIEAEIQKQLTDAVQHVLDAKAQELNYDSCLSVCSYIDTGVQKFDAEGRAFRAWRSVVWAKGYEILAQVQKDERAIPTEEELIAELPELVIVYEEVETPKSSLDYLNSLGQ